MSISNTHIDKNPYSLEIIKDSDGAGLALLENFYCLGVFDINFCPMCGQKQDPAPTVDIEEFDDDFDYKGR